MTGPCDPASLFEIENDAAKLFTLLFQQGVRVRCLPGLTIEEMLVDHVGIAREYLEQRLSTVFLDGSPVDDISTARIADGMTLALSSSMPGLAGATLRRKGPLASMRRSITYHNENGHAGRGDGGYITVKLFNVLAGEVGPILLKYGICVEASQLAEYIRLNPNREALLRALGKKGSQEAGDLLMALEACGTQTVEIITG